MKVGAGMAHAEIRAFVGSSGSGKSQAIKDQLAARKPPRLLIFDPQEEYGAYGLRVSRLATVREYLLRAGSAGPFAIVFRPTEEPKAMIEQFSAFCLLAYAARNLTLVCEELSDVTQAGWAPAGWSKISRKGRHRGVHVYGATQRPAAVDKHFFGNASVIRSGRLNFEADVKTMANVLGVSDNDIRNLPAWHWIERDMRTGEVSRGGPGIPVTEPCKKSTAA